MRLDTVVFCFCRVAHAAFLLFFVFVAQGVRDFVVDGLQSYFVSCVASASCDEVDTTASMTCYNGFESAPFELVSVDADELGIVVDLRNTSGYFNDTFCAANDLGALVTCPMTPSGCGSMELVEVCESFCLRCR